MKNKITAKTTLDELAAIVYHHLVQNGIAAILTGGSVVSIYTNNKYESKDLDFISPHEHTGILEVMKKIDFAPDTRNRKNLVHPKCQFSVEFPGRVTMIGGTLEPVDHETEVNGVKVKMLSPTQSAMDRLAAFIAWDDIQGLDQAEWICERHLVNLAKILKWASAEAASASQLKLIKERCERGIKKRNERPSGS